MGNFTDRERIEIGEVLTHLEKILAITHGVGGLKYIDRGDRQYVQIYNEGMQPWRTADVTMDSARGVFEDVSKVVGLERDNGPIIFPSDGEEACSLKRRGGL